MGDHNIIVWWLCVFYASFIIKTCRKFNISITTPTAAHKKRPQPRKPNFLASNNSIDDQSSAVLQNIGVEHSSLNATESIESVPRKQVFPLSHPNTIQHEEFTFPPSSPSEASLVAVNSSEDQQLLDVPVCIKRKDVSKLSLKQPTIVPLPPSAFEFKHPDSSKQSSEKPVQTDKQVKQQKVSLEEVSLADKQMKQQKGFPSQESQILKQQPSISELTGVDVKLKNLTLNQEILYIKRFLKKYYSLKEKLRYIQMCLHDLVNILVSFAG